MVLSLALVTLSATACAPHPLIANLSQPDGDSHPAETAPPGEPLHLSQTIDGVTVVLETAYADASQAIISYTVAATDGNTYHPRQPTLTLPSHVLTEQSVHGCLLQSESKDTFIEAVQAAARGERWFSEGVMAQVMSQPQAEPLKLKEQERELLVLMAQGLSNKAIAEQLGLANQTIRNYVSRLYSTIGVHSRSEAIRWGREHGLV